MPLPTFGIWQRKKPLVHQYWFAPVEGMAFDVDPFYQEIETELNAREWPGVEVSRVRFSEGGILSADREYLRLRRERLVFDICSAPFGKDWFFSCRYAEIQVTVMLWELIVILALLVGIAGSYVYLFGPWWGGLFGGSTLLGIFLLLRNALTLGLTDFDAWVLPVPVFGALYELVRKETYYRHDTRVMFGEMVDRVVKAKVEETTAAQGVELVTFKDALPDTHPLLVELLRKLR
jgi:hypothetical protein